MRFIMNEIPKNIIDIFFNNIYNYYYKKEYELSHICNIIDFCSNKFININNSFSNKNENIFNDISFNNNNKKFENEINVDFNKNNSIKDNIYNTNKNLSKKRNKFKVIYKTSRYKGVSKNKKNWQVYIRINNINTYLGSYSSEKTAAKIYDIMAIKKNGIKAKTNFKYNNKQIQKISKLVIDIDHIFEIVNKGLI